MKVEQLYTGCLAEAAYYIESNGEAAIIDPLRETGPYIKMLEERGAKLKYIFETHFHADFVSGHLDLAKKTGATIVYGPTAKTEFKIHSATDGEILPLGNVNFKVLHTPGHTLESSTYLLKDEEGEDFCIFTGDTLFIGDVGRPDLAIKTALTQEDLAGFLYESLHSKILPLSDKVVVYPNHGQGSACGKNMSSETFDTLGNQRKTNYALTAKTKEEFIALVLDGLAPPPQYFPKNAVLNKTGYSSYEEVVSKGLNPLSAEAFELVANTEEALILDTRGPNEFTEGFIPNSIFIGLNDGPFASWVGTLIIDLKQPILLVTDEGDEEEVIMRLARVGYDNTVGYLKGGFNTWKMSGKEIDMIKSLEATELKDMIDKGNKPVVLDARRINEFNGGHIEGAENIVLDFMNSNMEQFNREKNYHIHCAGGYRSVIMSSILRARGFKRLVNIKGGYEAITEAGIDVTASTLENQD